MTAPTVTPTPASEIVVGDLLVLPESPEDDIRTVEVHNINHLREGRVRIWVHTSGRERTRLSPWNYGQFTADATVQKVTP